jgi:hypothetical protein
VRCRGGWTPQASSRRRNPSGCYMTNAVSPRRSCTGHR